MDSSQAAFIPGRSIIDNLLMSHALVRGYERKRNSPRCALKVDIRKAYDTVHWRAVELMLQAYNFPEKMVKWLVMCYTTPYFSVLVNGSPAGYFPGKRGLRQGDPLSPYIFVLLMEVLGSLLKEGIESKGMGYHPKCKRTCTTHLSFADDVLIFTRAEDKSLECINVIL